MNDRKWQDLQQEVHFQFSRSSGPGGQHVNTSETKAELWWSIEQSAVMSRHQKNTLQIKLKNFLNRNGFVHLSHDRHRSREQNRKACLNRLRYLVEQGLRKAKPRKSTKPPRRAVEKRLTKKRQKGEKKRYRKKVDASDQ